MMFRQGTIAADRYLIATPIFNFTIPSTLKAYTDLSFIYAHSLQKHPEASEEGLTSARESIQSAIDDALS